MYVTAVYLFNKRENFWLFLIASPRVFVPYSNLQVLQPQGKIHFNVKKKWISPEKPQRHQLCITTFSILRVFSHNFLQIFQFFSSLLVDRFSERGISRKVVNENIHEGKFPLNSNTKTSLVRLSIHNHFFFYRNFCSLQIQVFQSYPASYYMKCISDLSNIMTQKIYWVCSVTSAIVRHHFLKLKFFQ